jgi:hypothetical protein
MQYIEDENGYITIPKNPISKSGIFQYLGKSISPDLEPDRTYNVWRPVEELNNPETIESFRLTPWIPEHVMLGEGFTPAETVGVQGVTGETVEFVGDTLYSKLKLFGEDLKKLIRAGLNELSCGFRCQWIIQSGMFEGKPYDIIQRQIRGNHLASVENARMGSDVRVAMDRAIFALDSIDFKLKPNGEIMDPKEVAKAIALALSPMQIAMDAMCDEMKDMKKEKAEDMEKSKAEDTEMKEKSMDEMTKALKAGDMYKDGMEEKAVKDAYDMMMKAKDEDDDKKSGAMDSAIKKLQSEFIQFKATAMDGNAVMKAFAEKQDLATKVSQIVGAFDHADLDSNGVAKYALGKIGIACDSGAELATLRGYLAARKAPSYTADPGTALDGGESAKSKTLDDLGL